VTLKKGEMNKVENIQKSFQRAKAGNGRLHLLGLISDGGVVGPLVLSSLSPW
jgi:2,3-bisphosphoglycerate-independent phosphoglycerate mutase